MKKTFCIILVTAVLLSLCACSSEPVSTPQPNLAPAVEATPEPTPQPVKEPSAEVIYEALVLDKDGGGSTYIAEIKNIGDMPIEISDISIDIETDDGKLLKVLNYVSSSPRIIDVGQSAYICESAITMLDTDINAIDATVAKLHYDIEKAVMPDMPVEVTQIELSNKMGYPNIIGKARNNGNEDLTFVYICAPLYSADGALQTVITTCVDVKAGEEASFDQMAIFADYQADYSDSVLGEVSVYPLF